MVSGRSPGELAIFVDFGIQEVILHVGAIQSESIVAPTAYRVVKYIVCAEFWGGGTNIIAAPSTNSGGTSPNAPPPVIYV